MKHFEAIHKQVEQIIAGTDCFIVEAQCVPGNFFKFFIDADTSFDLKRSVSTSRQLRKFIDEAAFFPEGNYSLEVSSPGLDMPLKQHRQYLKNIGRLLKVSFCEADVRPAMGRLVLVDETSITLSKEDKKSKTTTEQNIPFDQIKEAIIEIEF